MELLPILFVIGLFTMLNWPKKEKKEKDVDKAFANAAKDYLEKGILVRINGKG